MNGQKPYTLRDGRTIVVDAGIPDAALDRLNALPRMACEASCAGGHTKHVIDGGVEMTVAEMARRRDQETGGDRTEFEVAALGRTACVAMRLLEPGHYPFSRSPAYRVFTFNAPHLRTLVWIFAPAAMTDRAPAAWWDEVCGMLERVAGPGGGVSPEANDTERRGGSTP